MFNFTSSTKNANIQNALTELNQNLDFTDPDRYDQISFKNQHEIILTSYYQLKNIKLQQNKLDETAELETILAEDQNQIQIINVFKEIAQTLKIQDPEIKTLILSFNTSHTNISFEIFIKSPTNLKKQSNLNHYFENKLFIKTNYGYLNLVKIFKTRAFQENPISTQKLIPVLLTLKDYQTKFSTLEYVDLNKNWPTMTDNPLKE